MAALRAVELRRLLLARSGIGGQEVIPSLASRCRPASTAAPVDGELAGKSAYEVLGVGETSSNAEIKASFHRLAKETHPDVAAAAGSRFLQILAAYEVKHMHWYQVGEEVSPCECRCSRARLPPSRYWLFEPRCYMHDTGGWYIETFGRDKKGRTIPSPRQWDGFSEYSEKRLHPAMYLAAIAYRSLDLENARRRHWSISNFLQSQLTNIYQLCKKLLNGDKEVGMK